MLPLHDDSVPTGIIESLRWEKTSKIIKSKGKLGDRYWECLYITYILSKTKPRNQTIPRHMEVQMIESSAIYSSVYLEGFLWIFNGLRAEPGIPKVQGTNTQHRHRINGIFSLPETKC